MPEQLKINIVRSRVLNSFKCRKARLGTDSLSVSENKNFMKDLYAELRGPVVGSFYKEYVYFVGNDQIFLKSLDALANNYKIEYSEDIQDTRLDPKVEWERRIVRNILKVVLEELISQKGFCVFRRKKVAIPTQFLQSRSKFALIHNNQYLEGFHYILDVSFNGYVWLRIDPKVVALIPYIDNESGDFVVPQCLDVECQNFDACTLLPRNSVVFERLVSKEVSQCRGRPRKSAVVLDPKTGHRLTLPQSVLFTEATLGSLPYEETRSYSLKDPDGRKLYTERFLEALKTDRKLILEAGENAIVFDMNLFESHYTDKMVTEELSEYSIVPDIEVIFGDGLSNIDPYTGLKNYGVYSFNKASDRRYFHPQPRIFAFFPETQGKQMQVLLERLAQGHYLFPGFKEDTNPYNTRIDFETFSLKDVEEKNYLEKIKAKIENTRQEYPWQRGYLCLFSIPDDMPKFYDAIKDFCFARRMRTQMIKGSNLSKLAQEWYPLYNFSLSLFTKAGGTPWIIDSSYFTAADCYVGLAFAMRKHNQSASSRFFVGAADVFNAYGEHISFAFHQSTIDKRVWGLHVDTQFMEELMNKAIDRYTDKVGESPSSILIHKPGHFIRQEIEGVRNAIDEKGVGECFLIHVQHNSHFRAYDPKIDNQVRRNTYFKTRIGACVLFPTGYLEAKEKYHKMGTPKSVFLDMKRIDKTGNVSQKISDAETAAICKNYLAFTRIRWNMLGTSLREPLTIYAARKMADWLSKGYKSLEGIDVRDIL